MGHFCQSEANGELIEMNHSCIGGNVGVTALDHVATVVVMFMSETHPSTVKGSGLVLAGRGG